MPTSDWLKLTMLPDKYRKSAQQLFMSVFDVLCIGFGPAGLALAIQLENTDLNFCFVEKQKDFQWHSGMLMETARMRISFLKDLVTLVDPRSRFTFVNFLHSTNSLIDFINLDTCTPYRVQYNQYLKWVSNQLESHCNFGEEVIAVEPVETDGHVELIKVTSRTGEGDLVVRTTRNLVVSAGHKPNIPTAFQDISHVYHSSQFLHEDLPGSDVAVIGSGQSAAEITLNLVSKKNVTLMYRDLHLRTVETSPFVNQVFDPERTDFFFNRDNEAKGKILRAARVTNYSVIEPELLKELYGIMYRQKYTKDASLQLMASKDIESVSYSNNKVTLEYTDNLTHQKGSISVDAVVLATGYTQNHYSHLLSELLPWLIKENNQTVHKVSREYRLVTKTSFKARIYLQGYCEETHGISDTLLSVVSLRAKEIVNSILQFDTELEILDLKRVRSESEVTLQDETWLPRKPLPGTILYSKYFEHLQSTLTLEVAHLDKHLDCFHEWMNNPRVNEFWKEAGTKEAHRTYLKKMTLTASTIPVIGSFDGTPFGYFEIYWAFADNVGKYYPSSQYDRGIHFLVGDEKFRGPHRVHAWMTALIDFIQSDDVRTTRIVSEPRSDNAKMIAYLVGYGFQKHGLAQFPHKEAMIVLKHVGEK
jgi:L-ornithine N5-oxygenase